MSSAIWSCLMFIYLGDGAHTCHVKNVSYLLLERGLQRWRSGHSTGRLPSPTDPYHRLWGWCFLYKGTRDRVLFENKILSNLNPLWRNPCNSKYYISLIFFIPLNNIWDQTGTILKQLNEQNKYLPSTPNTRRELRGGAENPSRQTICS